MHVPHLEVTNYFLDVFNYEKPPKLFLAEGMTDINKSCMDCPYFVYEQMLSESEKVKKAYIILTQTQKTCHEHLHAATVVLSKVVAFPSNNFGIENFCYFDFRTFHQIPTFQISWKLSKYLIKHAKTRQTRT